MSSAANGYLGSFPLFTIVTNAVMNIPVAWGEVERLSGKDGEVKLRGQSATSRLNLISEDSALFHGRFHLKEALCR